MICALARACVNIEVKTLKSLTVWGRSQVTGRPHAWIACRKAASALQKPWVQALYNVSWPEMFRAERTDSQCAFSRAEGRTARSSSTLKLRPQSALEQTFAFKIKVSLCHLLIWFFFPSLQLQMCVFLHHCKSLHMMICDDVGKEALIGD